MVALWRARIDGKAKVKEARDECALVDSKAGEDNEVFERKN